MKPFDLEAAKRGDPVTTENGTQVHFVGVDFAGLPVVQFQGGPHFGKVVTSLKGNLFMAPKKRTVWVNAHPDGTAHIYDSPESAGQGAKVRGDRIGGKTWPMEIEE